MKSISNVIVAGILAGTATLAGAQAPAGSFVDRFNAMESYSGTGPAFHPAPASGKRNEDPVSRLNESQMQARSDEEPMWQSNVAPVQSNGPTFAQTNPGGLPFAYYEALSSKSDRLKLPVAAGAPADATASNGSVVAHDARNAPARASNAWR
jgi:hypothetical protein